MTMGTLEVNFRTQIAEELSRTELIDRVCEYHEKIKQLEESFNATSDPEQLLSIIEKVFGPGASKGCAERLRQIQVEGWTPEHDDQYDGDELAKASSSYILPEEWRQMIKCTWRKVVPCFFPRWDIDWWKPTPHNRIRELEKGISLGMAEIDRLKRKEEQK